MAKIDSTPIGLFAAGDLSLKQWAFGKIVAGGVAACAVLGERSDGVIGNPAKAAGEPVELYRERVAKVKVGAVAVAKGAELTPDANGLAITAVATNIVRAKANEAAAAGAIVEITFVDAYIKP